MTSRERKMTAAEYLDSIDVWASISLEGGLSGPRDPEWAGKCLRFEQYILVRPHLVQAIGVSDPEPRPVSELCRSSMIVLEEIADQFTRFKFRYDDFTKSNLLLRLLYCGERLRREECPTHRGSWSGHGLIEYDARTGRYQIECECQLLEMGVPRYDLTGWLPENIEELRRSGRVRLLPRRAG